MPEGDRFDRNIRRGWATAYDGIESGESTPAAAATELSIPLARDLKNGDGFPGSDQILDIVTACAGSGSYEEAFAALDRVVLEHGGHRYTVILVHAAKTLLLSEGESVALREVVFAERRLFQLACHDIVDNSFFGVGRYQLIEGGRFANETEAREYERRVHEAMNPATDKITEQLLADPTGKSIKVPRASKPMPTTEDLLNQAVKLS